MTRMPVVSSSIGAVGYEASTMTLEVEFRDSSVYQYFDVPEAVYQELMAAESVGKYYNQDIREDYRHAKL